MADNTIKERLDALDVGFEGLKFREFIQNGWKVRVSETGVKTAMLDIDVPTTWVNNSSPYGCYRKDTAFSQNLPVGIFTSEPVINTTAYAVNKNFAFLNVQTNAPSLVYTGTFETYLFDKTGTGNDKPTEIHYVVVAIGF